MHLHQFLFANKVQYAIDMELLPWLYDNKSVNYLQFVGNIVHLSRFGYSFYKNIKETKLSSKHLLKNFTISFQASG
jgi:hypothetical protein